MSTPSLPSCEDNSRPLCLDALPSCEHGPQKTCLLICCSANSAVSHYAHTDCLLSWVVQQNHDTPPRCPWCNNEFFCDHMALLENSEAKSPFTDVGKYFNVLRAHQPDFEACVAQKLKLLQEELRQAKRQVQDLSDRRVAFELSGVMTDTDLVTLMILNSR